MNINLELYRVFYVVAKIGNITKASQELMISQPAISKSIKNLEEQLGAQLFVRTKRGVILTSEGEIFYSDIKYIMEHIQNSERKFMDVINLESGSIKIGMSNSFRLLKNFLLPYLKEFNKQHPKINIQIIEEYTNETIQKLKDGLLDIAILKLPYNTRKDINIVKSKRIQDCFSVNNSYKELLTEKITLKDISNYPLIGLVKPADSSGYYLEKLTKENNVELKPNIESNNFDSLVELTKAGLGIGYTIKEYIEDEIKNKELFVLNVEPKIPKRYICVATAKNQRLSFTTKKLIEIITKQEKMRGK